mmetsp:Transcript_75496/g.180337  ORF Transcript_75496/g.180337 Transcript_75496/m.180337 type:complete len:201 (-) Transcript_75496:572-1174(-)
MRTSRAEVEAVDQDGHSLLHRVDDCIGHKSHLVGRLGVGICKGVSDQPGAICNGVPHVRGGVRNGIPRIFEGAPDIVHDLRGYCAVQLLLAVASAASAALNKAFHQAFLRAFRRLLLCCPVLAMLAMVLQHDVLQHLRRLCLHLSLMFLVHLLGLGGKGLPVLAAQLGLLHLQLLVPVLRQSGVVLLLGLELLQGGRLLV